MKQLSKTNFTSKSDAWMIPETDQVRQTENVLIVLTSNGQSVEIEGPGVHTRNGDTIRLVFKEKSNSTGIVKFGFEGGFEFAYLECDLAEQQASLYTSEWSVIQPVAQIKLPSAAIGEHEIILVKKEGIGNRVKLADIEVYWNGEKIIRSHNNNILPEMGVKIHINNADVELLHFIHEGPTDLLREYLHIGAWQMLNCSSTRQNVESICRAIRNAAELGIELLVTPEFSLNGNFSMQPIIENKGIEEAEAIIRACLRETSNAPYLIVGMPLWKDSEQGSISTAFNNCRVYAPNGDIERNCLKAHSCEIQYSHGHRLNEFEIHGIPICLHVCHDRRYPELTTLPVMFGSRLNIHPVNGGLITGTRESVQALAKEETWTNHAFYLRASAGGGSYIVGPQKFNNLITISSESMLTSVPGGIVGNPEEELIHAQIRIHDAFGYWPIRSYRASESIAEAYDHLYRAMGGKNI